VIAVGSVPGGDFPPSGAIAADIRHAPEAISQTNVCAWIVGVWDFRRFSLSDPSFKISPKGNGALHGRLACGFEQIVW